MQGLKRELSQGRMRVTDAIYDAGYSSSSRAYEDAQAKLGMSPRAFRQRGQGERIRYAIGECVLGRMLVAATERGLCAVFLGAEEKSWSRSCRASFHKRRCCATMLGWPDICRRCWHRLRSIPRAWTCRSTFVRLHFRRACGRRCARFREVRREATRNWRSLGQWEGRAGGGTSVRDQSGVRGDSLPSRDRQRRWVNGIPMGHRAEETAARDGESRQNVTVFWTFHVGFLGRSGAFYARFLAG